MAFKQELQKTRVYPTARNGNSPQVESKYFCESSNNEINISLELSSPPRQDVNSSLCFVLVIDASSSMSDKVGNQDISLFDRMKTFAGMMVDSVCDDDYLSIISFSHAAKVVLGITKMNDNGKDLARRSLSLMEIGGATNLEDGMTKALDEIKWARKSFWKQGNVRANIILFTDGMPNMGVIDPDRLVNMYRSIEDSMSGSHPCRIPLSAFTIGDYRPDVLVKIAEKLSNEAFYWLDENQEFEEDMMIPFFLKNSTHVSDVHIELQSDNGTYFSQERRWINNLENETDHQLTYFLHSLPVGLPKTIPLQLALPPEISIHALHGKVILRVNISYLDKNMKKVEFQDIIHFGFSTLFQIMSVKFGSMNIKEKLDAETLTYADASYIFISYNSLTSETWEEAKLSMLKNSQVQCMKQTVKMIEKTQIDPGIADETAAIVLQKMNGIQKRFSNIVYDDQVATKGLDGYLTKLKAHVDTAKEAKNKRGNDFSQLAAIASALRNETPAAGGISGLNENKDFGKKLEDFRQFLSRVKSNLRRTSPKKGSHKYARMTEVINNIHGVENNTDAEQNGDDDQNEIEWIFEDLHFVIDKNCSNRQELINTIQNFGGATGDTITTNTGRKTYVISAENGVRDKCLITEAQQKEIPTVNENFIEECVKNKELLPWFKFGLKH